MNSLFTGRLYNLLFIHFWSNPFPAQERIYCFLLLSLYQPMQSHTEETSSILDLWVAVAEGNTQLWDTILKEHGHVLCYSLGSVTWAVLKPSGFSMGEMPEDSQKQFDLSYTFSLAPVNSVCSVLQHAAKAISSLRHIERWAIRLENVDGNSLGLAEIISISQLLLGWSGEFWFWLLAKKGFQKTTVGCLTLHISALLCKYHQRLVYIGACLLWRLQERCWQAGASPVEDHEGVWVWSTQASVPGRWGQAFSAWRREGLEGADCRLLVLKGDCYRGGGIRPFPGVQSDTGRGSGHRVQPSTLYR